MEAQLLNESCASIGWKSCDSMILAERPCFPSNTGPCVMVPVTIDWRSICGAWLSGASATLWLLMVRWWGTHHYMDSRGWEVVTLYFKGPNWVVLLSPPYTVYTVTLCSYSSVKSYVLWFLYMQQNIPSKLTRWRMCCWNTGSLYPIQEVSVSAAHSWGPRLSPSWHS